jgi:hypothetical protein
MALALRWILPASLVALASCTASSPQPQQPAASASAAPGDSGAPTAQAAPPVATASAAASSSASARPGEPPQSVITNEPPPGGTVTANASPTGGSDRMQPMMDLVKANRDGFRKCFDLWGKKNPGQSAKIAFQFFLKPDGKLDKAAFKPDEGDLHAADVENCMIAFAKTLTYPASGSGKETVYTHRFEFKAAAK